MSYRKALMQCTPETATGAADIQDRFDIAMLGEHLLENMLLGRIELIPADTILRIELRN